MTVCQLESVNGIVARTKCGIERPKRETTGWSKEVTCPFCKAGTKQVNESAEAFDALIADANKGGM